MTVTSSDRDPRPPLASSSSWPSHCVALAHPPGGYPSPLTVTVVGVRDGKEAQAAETRAFKLGRLHGPGPSCIWNPDQWYVPSSYQYVPVCTGMYHAMV
jgi:hypothetical protein